MAREAARLSVALNIAPNAERDRMLAADLAEQGWTAEEVSDAARAIRADADLLAMIRRAGAVTIEPFLELRKRQAVLGPCFTFGCRTPATVAAWGDVYCRPCHELHRQKHRARDHARYRESPEFARKPVDVEDSDAPLLDMLNGKTK